jgi:hypothetical protein
MLTMVCLRMRHAPGVSCGGLERVARHVHRGLRGGKREDDDEHPVPAMRACSGKRRQKDARGGEHA